MTAVGGLALGAISGFFGGGGGMLCVPLLEASGVESKKAHATTIFVILPVCILSAAIYIANGVFEPVPVLCAVIGVTAGGYMGALLMDKISGTALAFIFAALTVAAGIKMLIK